jgi:hypothetical protein
MFAASCNHTFAQGVRFPVIVHAKPGQRRHCYSVVQLRSSDRYWLKKLRHYDELK